MVLVAYLCSTTSKSNRPLFILLRVLFGLVFNSDTPPSHKRWNTFMSRSGVRSTPTKLVARSIDRRSERSGDDLHKTPGFYEYEKLGEEGVEKEPLLSSEEGTGGQNEGDMTHFEEHLDRLEVNRDGRARRILFTVGTVCLRHKHCIVEDITIFSGATVASSCCGSSVVIAYSTSYHLRNV